MPDPRGELGQIGPHGDPNGDAAWLAAQASGETGTPTVSGVSYEGMSHSSYGQSMQEPYDEVKYSGQPC